jgi:hypothetical protein
LRERELKDGGELMKKELIGHNKEIEERIFKKYGELRIQKGLCRNCSPPKEVNDGLPVSFFVIGEDFPKLKCRVMFVGKTVQNEWESEPRDEASGFLDARWCVKEQLFLPSWSTYPFWQCIKEICQISWKATDLEEIWRRIAITNLVKCSTSPGLDTTPDTLKKNCIRNAGFFENEVKISQPTHMVFFTGLDYDEYLKELMFGYNETKDYPLNFHFEGKKITPFEGADKWWERDFLEGDEIKMRLLRTYHPGFYRKQEDKSRFCELVAKWITQSITQL